MANAEFQIYAFGGFRSFANFFTAKAR